MKQAPVVLASGNKGKLLELQDALADSGLVLKPQSEFAVPDAIEDKPTFIENALIKARHAAELTGLPAIADDSGLVVPALGGAPGIYSARYSGGGDQANINKLLTTMTDLDGQDRAAYFFCVLAFLQSANDPSPIITEGRWYGHIAESPSGDDGFGYDPIFRVGDDTVTAAQLTLAEKRAISHRGQAVRQLKDVLGR